MIDMQGLEAASSSLATAIQSKANDVNALVASVADGSAKTKLSTLLGAKAPTRAPTKIEDFEIVGALSADGKSTLRAKRGDQEFVLKAIPGTTPLERARVVHAQIASTKADSASLVKPLGFVCDGDVAYVVRPYVAGVTLAAIMKTLAVEEVPPDAPTWRLAAGARGGGANVTGAKMVCRIGIYAAEALAALHALKVLHGAIKPENLVCDDTVKPVVVDAGMGRSIPPFEAPEVIAASDRAMARNAASDLYALGALMYGCLTRQPVFPGDAEAVERATLKDKPASPLKANFKASNEMTIITLALLEKDPAKRYPNATELRDDLDRYHTNIPIQRKGPGLFSKLFG